MGEKIEVTDPITGETVEHDPGTRLRRRDYFIDPLGREIPDPRPLQPPVGYKKQPSLFEMVRAATQQAILERAREEPESFDEADDFDIPDDPLDPQSPWENDFDPPWSEVKEAVLKQRQRKEEADRLAASKAAETPGGGGSAATGSRSSGGSPDGDPPPVA